MRREQITQQYVEEILVIFAETCFKPNTAKKIKDSGDAFPLTQALLLDTPEHIAEIFHTGSLAWDLERVAGVSWKWNVSDEQGDIRIVFRKNKPLRDKTREEIECENLVNRKVAEYLHSKTSK